MLGSNDMKSALGCSAEDITEGMEMLIDITQSFPWDSLLDYPHPKMIIVSPPLSGSRKMALAGDRYVGAPEKSHRLSTLYAALARKKGVEFLDAASVLLDSPCGEAHGIDGMHLNERDHAQLAQALYQKIMLLS